MWFKQGHLTGWSNSYRLELRSPEWTYRVCQGQTKDPVHSGRSSSIPVHHHKRHALVVLEANDSLFREGCQHCYNSNHLCFNESLWISLNRILHCRTGHGLRKMAKLYDLYTHVNRTKRLRMLFTRNFGLCDAIFQQLVNSCQTRSEIKRTLSRTAEWHTIQPSEGRGCKAPCTSSCWLKRILWLPRISTRSANIRLR